jgi:mono/diheme cytochrome c family protein
MRGHLGAFVLGAASLLAIGSVAAAQTGPVTYMSQGKAWTPAARADFYSRDQGSRLIPLAWLRALKTPLGEPFLADGLARYGYLPNPAGHDNLPIGFFAAPYKGRQFAAMNCSACHTRQISVGGTEYRIDGGPAFTDFQALLTDLDTALGAVLESDSAFAAFAAQVLGPGAPAPRVAALKKGVSDWHLREHMLVVQALQSVDWGLGRLDAVSMIYNRLVGMDIGGPPTYLIPNNIVPANAPVRYPFLWNAPKQDRTQWPGFSSNGDALFGLTRNLGQVYGVFGIFRPARQGDHVDFLTDNSAQFGGLDRIETLVRKIGPPRWPWATDAGLAEQGRRIYESKWQDGGCAECHGKRPGALRLAPPSLTWATPLCDVGTDTREYGILHRQAATGVLQGARAPIGAPLGTEADTFSLLAVSVIGSIFQHAFGSSIFKYEGTATTANLSKPKKAAANELLATYAPPPPQGCGKTGGQYKYESRVMHGIWAAAPYLHNGSVATLADLLKPAAQRPVSFPVGRYYDIEAVGLAADQHGSRYMRTTTGCEALDSGNSRCGHQYGTSLSPADKQALLEYLKGL